MRTTTGPTPQLGAAAAVQNSGPPPKVSRRSIGRWFTADLDTDFFEQEYGALQTGDIIEFVIQDTADAKRGLGAGLLCAKYATTEAGGAIEIEFLAAMSPDMHDWLSNESSNRRGRLCLHLCTHARCRYCVEGQLILHTESWRSRRRTPEQLEWFWSAPTGTDTPGGALPGSGKGADSALPGGATIGNAPGPGTAPEGVGTGVHRLGKLLAADVPGTTMRDPAMTAVAGLGVRLGNAPAGPPPIAAPLDGEALTPADLAAFSILPAQQLAVGKVTAAELRAKLDALKEKAKPRKQNVGQLLANAASKQTQRETEDLEYTPDKADEEAAVTNGEVARRKKKKHRVPKNLESTSSADDDEMEESLFSRAMSGHNYEHHIGEVARRRPGRLLRHGLKTISKFLAERGAGADPNMSLQPRMVEYLTTVASATRAQPLNLRNERELRTLAEGLDHLLSGRLAEAGDLLIQRYKAVETAAGGESWELARHLEVIPPAAISAVSQSERAAVTAMRARELKVDQMVTRVRGTGHPAAGR